MQDFPCGGGERSKGATLLVRSLPATSRPMTSRPMTSRPREEHDMLFVVYCKDKPGDLRARLRADHLRHAIANAKPYKFGGPLIGEDGRVVGSIILFEV